MVSAESSCPVVDLYKEKKKIRKEVTKKVVSRAGERRHEERRRKRHKERRENATGAVMVSAELPCYVPGL